MKADPTRTGHLDWKVVVPFFSWLLVAGCGPASMVYDATAGGESAVTSQSDDAGVDSAAIPEEGDVSVTAGVTAPSSDANASSDTDTPSDTNPDTDAGDEGGTVSDTAATEGTTVVTTDTVDKAAGTDTSEATGTSTSTSTTTTTSTSAISTTSTSTVATTSTTTATITTTTARTTGSDAGATTSDDNDQDYLSTLDLNLLTNASSSTVTTEAGRITVAHPFDDNTRTESGTTVIGDSAGDHWVVYTDHNSGSTTGEVSPMVRATRLKDGKSVEITATNSESTPIFVNDPDAGFQGVIVASTNQISGTDGSRGQLGLINLAGGNLTIKAFKPTTGSNITFDSSVTQVGKNRFFIGSINSKELSAVSGTGRATVFDLSGSVIAQTVDSEVHAWHGASAVAFIHPDDDTKTFAIQATQVGYSSNEYTTKTYDAWSGPGACATLRYEPVNVSDGTLHVAGSSDPGPAGCTASSWNEDGTAAFSVSALGETPPHGSFLTPEGEIVTRLWAYYNGDNDPEDNEPGADIQLVNSNDMSEHCVAKIPCDEGIGARDSFYSTGAVDAKGNLIIAYNVATTTPGPAGSEGWTTVKKSLIRVDGECQWTVLHEFGEGELVGSPTLASAEDGTKVIVIVAEGGKVFYLDEDGGELGRLALHSTASTSISPTLVDGKMVILQQDNTLTIIDTSVTGPVKNLTYDAAAIWSKSRGDNHNTGMYQVPGL